ncbi:hypothetical protein [Protofrankia symbiont of Coriaria ruscifolia]|uniref:hypothetical protein n=1 Tax=Protofrankia symbiont of Coriaria ruscifolia TaxID=1306542 RepID=UPI0010417039|nr:hypothetical protein [Protofrankia symbiont of Coriaria ruscifolia]
MSDVDSTTAHATDGTPVGARQHPEQNRQPAREVVYQTSTISALLDGVYEGDTTRRRERPRHGRGDIPLGVPVAVPLAVAGELAVAVGVDGSVFALDTAALALA